MHGVHKLVAFCWFFILSLERCPSCRTIWRRRMMSILRICMNSYRPYLGIACTVQYTAWAELNNPSSIAANLESTPRFRLIIAGKGGWHVIGSPRSQAARLSRSRISRSCPATDDFLETRNFLSHLLSDRSFVPLRVWQHRRSFSSCSIWSRVESSDDGAPSLSAQPVTTYLRCSPYYR